MHHKELYLPILRKREQTEVLKLNGSETFKNCGSERQILLVLDGHRSHETLDISETSSWG